MKLYLASASTGIKTFDRLKDKSRLNYLETYIYFGKTYEVKDFVGKLGKKIFLDSGAFTAFTMGKKIDIYEYCDFIKKNMQYLEVYAGLDVIGDGEATLRNMEIMRAEGLNPLPTYHYGSPLKYFEKYVHEYDYIGIGGLVPLARKPEEIRKVLDYVFHYIKKHNLKTKVHGWGMTNPKFMKRYPFYSVDSTGWLAGGRFRKIQTFDRQRGTIVSRNASEIRNKTGRDWGKLYFAEINNNNINALYDYVDYINAIQKAQGMQYYL